MSPEALLFLTSHTKIIYRGAAVEVERLQAKVNSMSKRIRQLEDALAASHIASYSVEPHPLLLSLPLEEDGDSSDDFHNQVDSTSESTLVKSEENEALLDRSTMESFNKLTITNNRDGEGNMLDMSEVSLFISFHGREG